MIKAECRGKEVIVETYGREIDVMAELSAAVTNVYRINKKTHSPIIAKAMVIAAFKAGIIAEEVGGVEEG